jgi:predicted  nucleic acid-binding Zn-ribbon protein
MLSRNLTLKTRAEQRRTARLDRLNSSRHDFSLTTGSELAKRVDSFHRLVSCLNYPETFHALIPRLERFSGLGALVPRLTSMAVAIAFTSALAQNPVLAADAAKVAKPVSVKVETKNDSHLKKEDRETIRAINEIEGVEVDPAKFEEKKKKGFSLNPVGWLLKPVTDMQKRVVHLEQQIMRLEGPIAGLQKPMNGLRGQMISVQGNMGTLSTGMGKLDHNMGRLQGNMNSIESKMNTVNSRLGRMEQQLNRMYEPINGLQSPIEKLQKPVAGVSDQLSTLKKDLAELKGVVNVTSTLILIAIVSIGLLVVLGTPVVGVLAWKYRNKIIQKVDPVGAKREEEKQLAAVR